MHGQRLHLSDRKLKNFSQWWITVVFSNLILDSLSVVAWVSSPLYLSLSRSLSVCLNDGGEHMTDMLHYWYLLCGLMLKIYCIFVHLSAGVKVSVCAWCLDVSWFGVFKVILIFIAAEGSLSPSCSFYCPSSRLSLSNRFSPDNISSADVPWMGFLHQFLYSWFFQVYLFSVLYPSKHHSVLSSNPCLLSNYWVFFSLFITPGVINCMKDCPWHMHFLLYFEEPAICVGIVHWSSVSSYQCELNWDIAVQIGPIQPTKTFTLTLTCYLPMTVHKCSKNDKCRKDSTYAVCVINCIRCSNIITLYQILYVFSKHRISSILLHPSNGPSLSCNIIVFPWQICISS